MNAIRSNNVSLKYQRFTDIIDFTKTEFVAKTQFLCVPLENIFNLSVLNGVFPDYIKTSRTLPVFNKSGSPLEMNNYRPIAIINAFSQI